MPQATNFEISQTSWRHDHDPQHIKWTSESNFLQERGWLPEGTLLDCLEMVGKIIFHTVL